MGPAWPFLQSLCTTHQAVWSILLLSFLCGWLRWKRERVMAAVRMEKGKQVWEGCGGRYPDALLEDVRGNQRTGMEMAEGKDTQTEGPLWPGEPNGP